VFHENIATNYIQATQASQIAHMLAIDERESEK
jgi:hypothetical protein